MVQIVWPLSHNPGLHEPEGTGKLTNVFLEPRGDGTPVWRRSPGLSVFARTPSSGTANLDFDANARGAAYLSTFFEFVGYTTYNTEPTTTEVTHAPPASYPTNTMAGDLVFLQVMRNSSGFAFTEPSTDWGTLVETTANSTGVKNAALYYKVSTGETEVSITHEHTLTSTFAHINALLYTIRGAMSTAPICDTGTLTTGNTGDPDAPNITLTTANGLAVVCGWLEDDSVSTGTAPTSFGNALFHGNAQCTIMVAFQPRPTSGSVTISSFDTTGDDENAAYAFTIRHD